MQRDLVLRWLEAIRLLLAKLLHGDPGASAEMLEQQIDEALQQLLGTSPDLIERLDAASAAQLLNDPFRIFGYGELLSFKSAVLRARGASTETCRATAERGLALMLEAIGRADPVPNAWRERVAAVQRDLAVPAG